MSTEEQKVLFEIRSVVMRLDPEERKKVNAYAEMLRLCAAQHTSFAVAFALVGAEMAAGILP